ncbi:hypothetical protein LOC54_08780 [Acetobacter sp. AN02]|uniref:hypothetical protein n=1 Tax=Acetobacter sp. AN02 TaxID=2894186 RepID=UPI002434180F|nr:hypothetical protein [Acetobacter sp. AN02]MDG6095195.1 hypothetical protein [Acetobacter sp. AN02]
MRPFTDTRDQTTSEDVAQADISSAREALERMGGQARQDAARKSSPSPRVPHGPSHNTHQDFQAAARKRRFVRDGDVQVEHAALPGTRSVSGGISGDAERLRRQMAEERRERDDALRQVQELTTQVRTLETHLAHAKLLNEEMRREVAVKSDELLRAAVRLKDLEEARKNDARALEEFRESFEALRSTRRPGYVLAGEEAEETADEEGQRPVKWWKD